MDVTSIKRIYAREIQPGMTVIVHPTASSGVQQARRYIVHSVRRTGEGTVQCRYNNDLQFTYRQNRLVDVEIYTIIESPEMT